jgi:hypothetical protein
MAAILLSACTVTQDPLNGFNVYKIVTPATADDADTVDISSLVSADAVVSATCQGATDGMIPVALITTAGALTIPGATDNEARTIYVTGRVV